MADGMEKMAAIEMRARVANWATIGFGFLALAGPLLALIEGLIWLTWRRWPTVGSVIGWIPSRQWERILVMTPFSLLLFLIGGTAFWSALFYWRRQEGLLRRLRGRPKSYSRRPLG